MTPRLACFDLDNTLIDRDGAFLAWAQWWAGREGLGTEAVEWLLAHDEGGFRARPELFAGVKERFGLGAEVSAMVDAYDREHPSFTSVDTSVLAGRWAVDCVGRQPSLGGHVGAHPDSSLRDCARGLPGDSRFLTGCGHELPAAAWSSVDAVPLLS